MYFTQLPSRLHLSLARWTQECALQMYARVFSSRSSNFSVLTTTFGVAVVVDAFLSFSFFFFYLL